MQIQLKRKYCTGKSYKGAKASSSGNGQKKHAAAPGMRRQTIKGASHSGTGAMSA